MDSIGVHAGFCGLADLLSRGCQTLANYPSRAAFTPELAPGLLGATSGAYPGYKQMVTDSLPSMRTLFTFVKTPSAYQDAPILARLWLPVTPRVGTDEPPHMILNGALFLVVEPTVWGHLWLLLHSSQDPSLKVEAMLSVFVPLGQAA